MSCQLYVLIKYSIEWVRFVWRSAVFVKCVLFFFFCVFFFFFLFFLLVFFSFFFFNDTATTEIYTLSLHDALPIWELERKMEEWSNAKGEGLRLERAGVSGYNKPKRTPSHPTKSHVVVAKEGDRKSTRLNSSHGYISYAVFCLKKKKQKHKQKQKKKKKKNKKRIMVTSSNGDTLKRTRSKPK